MNLTFLTLLLCLFSYSTFCQSERIPEPELIGTSEIATDTLGKRPSIISASILLSSTDYEDYAMLGLDDGYQNYVDGGFVLGYDIRLKPRMMLGLEYSMTFSKFPIGVRTMYTYDSVYVQGLGGYASTNFKTNMLGFKTHPGIQFHTHRIFPKIEWKFKRSKLPSGFSHEVGLGILLSYPLIKDYDYELNNPDSTNASYMEVQNGNDYYTKHGYSSIYDTRNGPFLGAGLFYGVKYKKRIAEKILLTMGVRLRWNLTFYQFNPLNSSQNKHWMSNSDMQREIGDAHLRSFFRMTCGIAYLL